jgi:hypothetical protein
MKKLKLSLVLLATGAILLALSVGCVSPGLVSALANNNSSVDLDTRTPWGSVKLRRRNPPPASLAPITCAQCPICWPRPANILDLPTGAIPR